jgi:hypothetical protein
MFKDEGSAAYEVGHSEIADWRNCLRSWSVDVSMLNKQ